MLLRVFLLFFILLLISSCGQRTKSFYDKNEESTYVKIDTLDLMQNSLQLRIEYRSYKEKVLVNLQCDISFNQDSEAKIQQHLNLSLSSFSTEVINIDKLNINNSKLLFNQKTIDYRLKCELQFDKGNEIINNQSVLHLVPASRHKYR